MKRHEAPVSEVDRISQLHDLRYALASNNKQIRRADDEFINYSLKSASQDLSFSHPL